MLALFSRGDLDWISKDQLWPTINIQSDTFDHLKDETCKKLFWPIVASQFLSLLFIFQFSRTFPLALAFSLAFFCIGWRFSGWLATPPCQGSPREGSTHAPIAVLRCFLQICAYHSFPTENFPFDFVFVVENEENCTREVWKIDARILPRRLVTSK